MKPVRVLVLLVIVLLAALPGASASADSELIQLVMVVDGSGSIDPQDWQQMTQGLADAIEHCVRDDGVVELTVVQFASSAVTEVKPEVITQANKAAVAAQIAAMTQMQGSTTMEAGFNLAVAEVVASTNYSKATKRVMNLSTDGVPNVKSLAEAARDNALSEFDEIDAEAVGFGPDLVWLRDEIVYPQPGEIYGGAYPPWPPDGPQNPGWVAYVQDFAEYAATVCSKVQVVTEDCCIGKNCPDDPEATKNCYRTAPPFYVVINRQFQDLSRPGTGCQPIILKHPGCKDCCDLQDPGCQDALDQMEDRVCPLLASRVEWGQVTDPVLVYQMCCASPGECKGMWQYYIRDLQPDGSCPIAPPPNDRCFDCLPPGTGIDLPAPVIVGGLASLGIGLLAAGLVLRRRLWPGV
jgi:uncharacterized protein YegL